MAPDFVGHGHPRKITRKARELGVHNDCLLADSLGACTDCAHLMQLAYDFFYGHLRSIDDFREAVLTDMIEDQMEAA